MKTTQICSRLRATIKHYIIAVALGTWLTAGTAMAAAPANDNFADAIALTGVASGQTGAVVAGTQSGTTNVEATLESGEPNGGGGTGTVWFKWTSPDSGSLTFYTNGSAYPRAEGWDAVVGLYTGSSAGALTSIGGPQDGDYPETMTRPVVAGTTYYIQVAGYENEATTNLLLTWNFVATVYEAKILTMGPGSAFIGDVVANAADIGLTVPYSTNMATLAPTFTLSPGATCNRTSGAIPSPNFGAGSVTYTVTSGGGSPVVNVYTVTATEDSPSPECVLTSFATNVAGTAAVITSDTTTGTVNWYVPNGTVLSSLAPAYTTSAFATGSPASASTQNFSSPVHYIITAQDTNFSRDYTVTVNVARVIEWNVAGGGNWDLATTNWILPDTTPTAFASIDDVTFNKTSGGTINITSGVQPHSTTVSAASGTYTFSNGPIAAGSLTKSGGGTLVMAKYNSYPGGTTISSGTLLLDWPGDGVSHTTLGSGPVTLDGGILFLCRTDLANALTVNGGSLVSEDGFGNTYTGPITLNATLPCAVYYTLNCSGTISGDGGIAKTQAGPMILSGTNTYTGPTSVTGGILQCNNVNALGGGDLIISGTGKVNLNYAGTKTVSSLTLGGLAKVTPGTYGSVASGADFQDDTYFSSNTGTVTVAASGYSAWATLYAGGAAAPAGGDFNNDGVQNGIAYFMGATGTATNPGLNASNVITWPMSPTFSGSYEVQTSPDLNTWTNVTPRPTPASGNVSYTLAPGLGSRFVRLIATPTP